ncbi:hypothetical protein J421_1305 [Gemmatirosa kalamazoonensis]|uniref:Uncharacterized protein n=1 Tax=Gemmatirosa kalamazoonensis TaxID=861299 RepID=W0REG8_9BACT|nr:hypothetical protein [Gemmatirosa kalamazoonensis]AHG88842.1 hypothetical protein J421_1305 [Gemmatirosa kalamazoonensis]
MTVRRTLAAAVVASALALGGWVAPLRAQDARLSAIPDADARAAVGAIIVEAEGRGLPREPLVTKALEGVQKGAPGERIEAAVRAMVGRLLVARDALAPTASPAELDAAAGALAAGVTADAIRVVRLAAPSRSITVALGVLAQLTVRGVPAARAAQAVATLVQRGASHAQLLSMQREVQDDLAAGVPPSTALDLRFRAVIAALPPPAPAPIGRTAVPTSKP